MLSAIIRAAASTVLWTFPLAVASAAFYRFPIPLAGYQTGANAAAMSLVAVGIYGLMGGFPLLAMIGGAAGWIVRSRTGAEKDITCAIQAVSFVIAASGVAIMANLDYIIGPW